MTLCRNYTDFEISGSILCFIMFESEVLLTNAVKYFFTGDAGFAPCF